jgi:hypothetical protein
VCNDHRNQYGISLEGLTGATSAIFYSSNFLYLALHFQVFLNDVSSDQPMRLDAMVKAKNDELDIVVMKVLWIYHNKII